MLFDEYICSLSYYLLSQQPLYSINYNKRNIYGCENNSAQKLTTELSIISGKYHNKIKTNNKSQVKKD